MEAIDVTKVVAQAALITLCAVTAGVIACDPKVRMSRAWLVPVPFMLFALAIASGLANAYDVYAERPALAGLSYGIVLLIPPAVHLAIRQVVAPAYRPGIRATVHVLPAVLTGTGLAIVFHRHGLGDPLSVALVRALWFGFCAIAAFYLAAAAFRVTTGYNGWRAWLSVRGGAAQSGLSLALLLLALPIAALAVELLVSRIVQIDEGTRLLLGFFRMGCVAAVAILSLQARRLFPDADLRTAAIGPDAPSTRSPTKTRASDGAGTGAPAAYARSPLDAATARRVAARLTATMQRQTPYRDPFFALRDLSEAAGVPPHRVSQVLNQFLGVNFFDFVNGWRIREACRRLTTDPATSVLTIAEDVGFNSKSTFNAAFRKHAGMTPSEWRQRPVQDASANPTVR